MSDTNTLRRAAAANSTKFWSLVIGAILSVKIALVVFDHVPLFFLGDSEVYILSAVTEWKPVDRSFFYGMAIIGPVLRFFGSLEAVVVVQSIIAGSSAILLTWILIVLLRAPAAVGVVAGLVYAVDPTSILWERQIMTETVSTNALVIFVALTMLYVARPRLWMAPLIGAAGFLVVSFRATELPVLAATLLAAVVTIIVANPHAPSSRYAKGGAVLALTACFAFGQVAYTRTFAAVTNNEPAYNFSSGMFLLTAWAPLVRAEDFPDPAVGTEILSRVTFPLEDRHIRANQLFTKGGLAEVIYSSTDSHLAANRLAGTVASHILLTRPQEVLVLAAQTYSDFWDFSTLDWTLTIEKGHLEVSQGMIDRFRDEYGEDISGHHRIETPAKWWLSTAAPWLFVVLLSPIALLLCLVFGTRYRLLLTALTLSQLAIAVVAVHSQIFRYLHPLSWMTVLLLAYAASAAMRAIDARSTGLLPRTARTI